MIVGILQLDVHVPHAQSLKDRRSVIKSLKDQLRGQFNVAVAEIDAGEKWQRATVGIVTLGDTKVYVDGLLDQVTNWIRLHRLVELIQLEREYF